MKTLEECQSIQIGAQRLRIHAPYLCFFKNASCKNRKICPWLTVNTSAQWPPLICRGYIPWPETTNSPESHICCDF